MVYVTHDGYDRRSWNQVLRIIFIIIILQVISIFQSDKFYFKTKFAGYQFNDFRIQTLVNGHHDTEVHTLANYIGKAYVHQVGQFTYGHKFCYLQPVIDRLFAHRFSGFIAFGAAVFGFQALSPSTRTGQFGLGFADLFLNGFLIDFFVLPANGWSTAAATVTTLCTATVKSTTLAAVIASAGVVVGGYNGTVRSGRTSIGIARNSAWLCRLTRCAGFIHRNAFAFTLFVSAHGLRTGIAVNR